MAAKDVIREYTFFLDSAGTITHYKKSAKNKKVEFISDEEFVFDFMQSLGPDDRSEFRKRIEGKPYSVVFKSLFEHAEVQKPAGPFKPDVGKNCIYLQFLNEDRNSYEVLLLANPETKTFIRMGRSSDDDLFDKMNAALKASLNPDVADWYDGMLMQAREADIKEPKKALSFHLDMLLRRPEYHVDDIKNISNDPNIPNYAYYDLGRIKQLAPKPTPKWDEFTSMFVDHDKIDLFQAWVWSIFDASNTGRQWLWIQGNGEEGKSTMYECILRYMDTQFGRGRAYFAITNTSHDSNRFFFSQAEGKRLGVFGDTREIGLLRNENFLKLSGNDVTVVEGKNKQAYSNRIYCKLLLLSNVFPEINFASRAELSRIIMLRLQPERAKYLIRNRTNEAQFGDMLFEEFEAFLRKCHDAYEKCLKPGSYSFKLPQVVMDDMLSHCMTHEYLIEQYFIKHFLEFDAAYNMPVAMLQNGLKAFGGDELRAQTLKFNLQNIRMVIEDKHDCKYLNLETSSGLKVPHVVGCRLKSNVNKKFIDVFREEQAKGLDLTEL